LSEIVVGRRAWLCRGGILLLLLMMMMMMVLMVLLLMVVLVLLLLLLVDKLHLDPPTARRHRLDRRPLPVADARTLVSTCMPGGHQRGTQRH
jgi:uncharacterized membrane protein